jgi:peptide/nickel transport system ATP-binding protein
VGLVEVESLRVELAGSGVDIVNGISFTIDEGEVLGVVGESGSGKTTIGLALLGHVRRGARIVSGSVRIGGLDVLSLERNRLREVRGKLVAYIPQDPAAALNSSLRIGKQLAEMIEVHEAESGRAAVKDRIRNVLNEVKLPDDDNFLRRFPHQLSGGQQQRVCLAMAFLLRPSVIVLDEPTTGLDVTTQAHVIATVRNLCRSHGVAALYITHDLAVIANLAHRVMVLYAGRLAEVGPTRRIFGDAGHPYTRKLIGAIPDVTRRRPLEAIRGQAPGPGRRPSGCPFHPRCPDAVVACAEVEPTATELAHGHFVSCLKAGQLAREGSTSVGVGERSPTEAKEIVVLSVTGIDAFHGQRQVLDGVSLDVRRRECLALVGESGSGKTTLARSIIGLHAPERGEIRFNGEALPRRIRDRDAEARRSIQYIFQSPYNSLNPRRSVSDIVALPLHLFFGLRRREAGRLVAEALEKVSLSPKVGTRYPDELSGGERQRVAIARALACAPVVLICDEVTSALDTSVQAAIVELLNRLQAEENLALLFITHNLPLVRTIADRVAVIHRGRIAELGPTNSILDTPKDDYTRELITNTPRLSPSASALDAAG